ncbi:MAG: hypothetical protein JRM72_01450 [Nitrososphaerota archaeon]|nr:hypothetical protein [Nitrososphaerota archaeon]
MKVVLNFNNRPSLKIGKEPLITLSLSPLDMRALMILAQNGTLVNTVNTKHAIQTYEVSEFTANLLLYMLDESLTARSYHELEVKLGLDDEQGINEMVDTYIKAKKELDQLGLHATTTGTSGYAISIPFNSGTLTINPTRVPPFNQIAYLLSIKTKAINIQYLINILSPYTLLKIKSNPVASVVSDLNNKYDIIEDYVKINGKDFKTMDLSYADGHAVVIRRNNPVIVQKSIQLITPQYKTGVITAIKKDIPIEAIQALS